MGTGEGLEVCRSPNFLVAFLGDFNSRFIPCRIDIPHILDVYFKERGGRNKVLNYLREKRARESAYSRKKDTAKVKGRVSKNRA
jgi:hypothetical protein